MYPTPRVSVIIVNWNSGDCLRKCLACISSQSFKPYRIIVIDNASEDTSLSALGNIDANVEIIRLKKNIGFAAANNLGVLNASQSEWIALLNPDAFPAPDWLASLMAAVSKWPRYSFFGSRMICADEPGLLDGIGDVYHTSGMVWRSGHGRPQSPDSAVSRRIFSPCAAAALYRRDAFEDAGGFDEEYFCYSEDVDLGFRLRLLGYNCRYVPDATVYHIGSAMTGRKSDFSVYYGHRNLVWTYFKNMPTVLMLAYLPQHVLLNLFSLIWFLWRGRFGVIFKAKQDAFRLLPRIWEKRKAVQDRRKIKAFELVKLMAKGVDIFTDRHND